MINNFKNWRLRLKLLVAFAGIVITSLSFSIVLYLIFNHRIELESALIKIEKIKYSFKSEELAISSLLHEIYKSDDFQRGQIYTPSNINDTLINLTYDIIQLQGITDQIDSSHLYINSKIKYLVSQKVLLYENLIKRGFKDFGLEGELRSAVHSLEKINHIDKIKILTLRRHEKDFMLRKDWKYVDELNKNIDGLIASIDNGNQFKKDTILHDIWNYQRCFNSLAETEKIIGLNNNMGIRFRLNSTLLQINLEIGNIERYIHEQIYQAKVFRRNILLLSIILVTSLSFLISIRFTSLFNNIIKEILFSLQTFASGNLPPKFLISTNEEIGQLKAAFNQLIDRIEQAQNFAINLGNGKFNTVYKTEFENDLLAQALIKASYELQLADSHRKENEYINQGLASLGKIVSNREEPIENLGYRILCVFINCFDAKQGVLYSKMFTDNKEWQLKPITLYAYGRKKFVPKSMEDIPPTVQQCVLEKDIIYFSEVPENYIKITSGLGEALPTAVILSPILFKEQVIGVIELAFFTSLSEIQITLIRKLCIQAGAILESKIAETETDFKSFQIKSAMDLSLAKQENLEQELELAIQENKKLKALLQTYINI